MGEADDPPERDPGRLLELLAERLDSDHRAGPRRRRVGGQPDLLGAQPDPQLVERIADQQHPLEPVADEQLGDVFDRFIRGAARVLATNRARRDTALDQVGTPTPLPR